MTIKRLLSFSIALLFSSSFLLNEALYENKTLLTSYADNSSGISLSGHYISDSLIVDITGSIDCKGQIRIEYINGGKRSVAYYNGVLTNELSFQAEDGYSLNQYILSLDNETISVHAYFLEGRNQLDSWSIPEIDQQINKTSNVPINYSVSTWTDKMSIASINNYLSSSEYWKDCYVSTDDIVYNGGVRIRKRNQSGSNNLTEYIAIWGQKDDLLDIGVYCSDVSGYECHLIDYYPSNINYEDVYYEYLINNHQIAELVDDDAYSHSSWNENMLGLISAAVYDFNNDGIFELVTVTSEESPEHSGNTALYLSLYQYNYENVVLLDKIGLNEYWAGGQGSDSVNLSISGNTIYQEMETNGRYASMGIRAMAHEYSVLGVSDYSFNKYSLLTDEISIIDISQNTSLYHNGVSNNDLLYHDEEKCDQLKSEQWYYCDTEHDDYNIDDTLTTVKDRFSEYGSSFSSLNINKNGLNDCITINTNFEDTVRICSLERKYPKLEITDHTNIRNLLKDYNARINTVRFFDKNIDGNSFEHSRGPNGFTSTYYLGSQYINALSKYGNKRDIIKSSQQEWVGSCFGIAMTMALNYNGLIDVTNLSKTANDYYHMEAPCNNPYFKNTIQYYQLSQSLGNLLENAQIAYTDQKWINSYRKLNNNELDPYSLANCLKSIVNATLNNNKAYVLSFGYYSKDQNGNYETDINGNKKISGHSIVAHNCSYNEKENFYELQLYDENYFFDTSMIITPDFKHFRFIDGIRNHSKEKNEYYWYFGNISSADSYLYIELTDPNTYCDPPPNAAADVNRKNNTLNLQKIKILSQSPNNRVSISFPVNSSFYLSNASGEYLKYNSEEVDSTLEIYDFKNVVNGENSEIILSLDYSDSFVLTNNGELISMSIYNDNTFLSLDDSDAKTATFNLKNDTVDFVGVNYKFNTYIATGDNDNISDHGLVCVSAYANGSVSLSAESGSVKVNSDNEMSDISVNSGLSSKVCKFF